MGQKTRDYYACFSPLLESWDRLLQVTRRSSLEDLRKLGGERVEAQSKVLVAQMAKVQRANSALVTAQAAQAALLEAQTAARALEAERALKGQANIQDFIWQANWEQAASAQAEQARRVELSASSSLQGELRREEQSREELKRLDAEVQAVEKYQAKLARANAFRFEQAAEEAALDAWAARKGRA